MIAQLEMELGMLKDAYEDSDRQDAELRAAIRKTRAKIKALKSGKAAV